MDLEYLETREGPFKENSRQRCYGRDILLSDNAFKKTYRFFPGFFRRSPSVPMVFGDFER